MGRKEKGEHKTCVQSTKIYLCVFLSCYINKNLEPYVAAVISFLPEINED